MKATLTLRADANCGWLEKWKVTSVHARPPAKQAAAGEEKGSHGALEHCTCTQGSGSGLLPMHRSCAAGLLV